jgi:hypothetical protein
MSGEENPLKQTMAFNSGSNAPPRPGEDPAFDRMVQDEMRKRGGSQFYQGLLQIVHQQKGFL